MNSLVEIERAIKSYEQLDIKVEHMFSRDMYIRQAFIPKDSIIVGKRHREETLNILLKGKMIIHDGNTSIEVEAPFMAVSKPFTKKVGVALEDSIWCNVHVTKLKDLEKIEKEVIIPEEEYNNLIIYKEKQCLG